MRYVIRALKYFVYLTILLTLFVLILAVAGFVPKDIDQMFVHGAASIPQMLIIVAVFAAVYPRIGFTARNIRALGDSGEIEPKIEEYMKSHRYVLVKKEGEDLVYRKASTLDRISKMWEDAISFKRVVNGYTIEGRTKDVVRLDTGLTQLFEPAQE